MPKRSSTQALPVDVICGMEVHPEQAEKTEYQGDTYYFCCPTCKSEFERNPSQHAGKKKSHTHSE